MSEYNKTCEFEEHLHEWSCDDSVDSFIVCTNCKKSVGIGYIEDFEYCPNCGAKRVNREIKVKRYVNGKETKQ